MKRSLIAAFIAITLIFSSFGITPVQAQDCGSLYTVQPGDTLSKIAQFCGVSYAALVEVNPSIDNPRLIYPGQVINIPRGSGGNGEEGIPVTGGSIYIVKPNDSVANIASRFRITSQALTNANPWLVYVPGVYPGMRLTLPQGARSIPTLSITPNVGSAGETVTLAATGFQANQKVLIGFGRFGKTYYQVREAITDANGAVYQALGIPVWVDEMHGDYVFVVQNQEDPNIRALSNYYNLVEPRFDEPEIPATGGPTVESYLVKPDDTLFEIAQRYNTTLSTLLALNPTIVEPGIIYPGQLLRLPRGTRPAGPYVTVSAPVVSPGGELRVKAYNFPSRASVDIRLVAQNGQMIRPYDAITDAQGNLAQIIRVPNTVENGLYSILVVTTDRRIITQATSRQFEVRK